MNRSLIFLAGLATLALLSGCVQTQVIKANPTPLVSAQDEIPDDAVLDVGVAIFDPGLAGDLAKQEDEENDDNVFREVRRAEARYMAYQLKSTLEDSGNWGAVRVLPRESDAIDLMVQGEIRHSDGERLSIEITAIDSTNKVWLKKAYADTASKFAYKDHVPNTGDPFQDIYNSIANDLLQVRKDMSYAQLENIRTVSELKFAQDLAPSVFSDYLDDSSGEYEIVRLPAPDDPMVARMLRIRQREYMFIDTIDEHYAGLNRDMEQPYDYWRKFTFEEAQAQRELKASARNRMLAGAAMVIGGVIVDQKAQTQGARVVGTGGVVAGIATFKSGWDRNKEAKLHAEAIKELSESMEAQVAPMVVDVEGQTVELTGTIDAQYDEWRHILKEIYAAETGIIVGDQDGATEPDSRPQ